MVCLQFFARPADNGQERFENICTDVQPTKSSTSAETNHAKWEKIRFSSYTSQYRREWRMQMWIIVTGLSYGILQGTIVLFVHAVFLLTPYSCLVGEFSEEDEGGTTLWRQRKALWEEHCIIPNPVTPAGSQQGNGLCGFRLNKKRAVIQGGRRRRGKGR